MAKGHRWFAAMYDTLMRAQERSRVGALRRRLLGDLQGDILEVGAGTGASFEYYGAVGRVIATEPDPHMLKRAQAKLVALGRTNIDVRQAGAESLPFDDASFDAVVCTLVLCSVSDPARALSEMRRVLRPGGELRLIEHIRPAGLAGRMTDIIQPVYGWFAGGCHANRRTGETIEAAGFDASRLEHGKINPITPAIYGVAALRP